MRRGAFVVGAALAAGLAAGTAWAQGQACLYEGETFPEGSVVCQAGLLQNCVNGEWQNNGGERCDQQADDQIEGNSVTGAGPMADDD